MDAKKKTIGEMEFQLNPLMGMKALRVFHRLSKSIIPALTKAMGSFDMKASLALSSLQIGKLSEAVEQFFLDCKEEDLVHLTKELLTGAVVDNNPLDRQFDTVFQGKILTLLEVLVWSVTEVHFSDFLDKLPALQAQAEASQKTSSLTSPDDLPTTSASSGPRGASLRSVTPATLK